ncbi:MAG: biotin/lipoyl-binding protein [Rhizonema sp. PD37]|nr:biotin/lipoyl-binding protein [Rhizonema sp. PD37]
MTFKVLSKHTNSWLIGLVVSATAITGGIIFYGISQYGMVSQKPALVETDPPVKKVTALGRIEPEAEVIKLSAPLALDGDRITQLLVKESQQVKVGQVIAILDSLLSTT